MKALLDGRVHHARGTGQISMVLDLLNVTSDMNVLALSPAAVSILPSTYVTSKAVQ